ncbi:hypothetical protein [Sunxiuqinia rutila]|uniref:hypothetical protein n=1 Tax=Sunxiuqinia rutila TaxID=1397841 RepID=UPI003D35A96B
MKQTQINRKNMIEATLSYLDEKSPLWQSIAKIGEVKNKLSEVSQAIDVAAAEQLKAQVNAGKMKTELKRTMSQKGDILNDMVEVFAVMTGDETLKQTMGQSASDLFKMKNDDMLRQIKLIIDAATEHQQALTDGYGLTAEQLADLQADYDRFLELSGLPREYQIKSGVATLTLDELFSEASDLLTNQLDNLMKIFKRRDPALYAGYEKARIVVDY